MLSSYSEYPYFVRTTKAAFWEDRERVKSWQNCINHTFVSGIWKSQTTKNIAIKKIAKKEIETHIGLLGDLCVTALHIWQIQNNY